MRRIWSRVLLAVLGLLLLAVLILQFVGPDLDTQEDIDAAAFVAASYFHSCS